LKRRGVGELRCESLSTRLNADSPYSRLIGAEYRVVGEVNAFGLAAFRTKGLEFVTLIPGPLGIDGGEIAFRRKGTRDQRIRILSAWHRPVFSASGMYYLVEVEGADWGRDIPVRIEMMRGNEGVGPLETHQSF
jgi:hypothetical protein